MNTLVRTGAVLFGLLIGISAVAANPLEAEYSFGSGKFWTELTHTSE